MHNGMIGSEDIGRINHDRLMERESKKVDETLDERELDKELQRRPYTNDGENHD